MAPGKTIGALIDVYMEGDLATVVGGWHGARREYPRRPDARHSEADNMFYALRDLGNTTVTLPAGDAQATRSGPVASSRHMEDLEPDAFTPADLRAVQAHMVRIGLCRNQVNARKNRILRFFRWMVNYGHAQQVTVDRLENVLPIKAHHPGVRLSKEVKAVAPEVVKRTMECAPHVLAQAIEVQLRTGMRPQELVNMRIGGLRLTHTRENWEYLPLWHKTQHKRTIRIIKCGPEVQVILRDRIDAIAAQGCLMDGEIVVPRIAAPGADLTGGDQRRIWPWRTVGGYYQAIKRAAKRAGEDWAPNQLRHAALTLAAAVLGDKAAAQVAGHTDVRTTRQHYIEPNLGLAEQYAQDFG